MISTSYSYNEADLFPAYAIRQCNEYAKLGLMGVTFLYSSGDGGVAGDGGVCLNTDGAVEYLSNHLKSQTHLIAGSQSTEGKMFNPSFPGTCPYVTALGATQVSPGQSVWEHENVCEQVIYSGGGLSNYFGMSAYQMTAVEGYLAPYPISYPKDVYDTTRVCFRTLSSRNVADSFISQSRAFPDISANGANYVAAVDGAFIFMYGTSASSPVVGAILTMVNDVRIARGKSPIGFINPAVSPTLHFICSDCR